MSAQLFTWGWRAQPPMAKIAAAVTSLSAHGKQVHMREVDTESDEYAWIVSDVELTGEQAAAFYEDDERIVRVEVNIEPPVGGTITEVMEIGLGELIGLEGMARQSVIDEAAADLVNNVCSWGATELPPEGDGDEQ